MSILKDGEAALTGAIGLAMGDAGAVRHFPNSEPAFWRSFAVIGVIAPVNLMIAMLSPAERVGETGLISELIILVLVWIAYPVAMIFVTRLIGLGARFPLYIIAYNWSSILILAVLLPASIISAIGGEPGGIAILLSYVSIGYALWYSAFLARSVLETVWSNAAAIVILDVALTLLVSYGVTRLFA